MENQRIDNIWFALEENESDAINLTLRSDLMTSIEQCITKWKLPHDKAAKRLGITSVHFDDFKRGKISCFSLDNLSKLAVRAGLTIEMNVKPKAMKRARNRANVP